jgi:Ala-tRNA(Pro) deacylase
MQECRQVVFEKLKKAGIEYELIEHPAMHTIEEMEALELNNKEEINKNLFLRDDKKKRYLLLMLSQDKKVDLKELSAKINSRPQQILDRHYLVLNQEMLWLLPRL